MPDRFRDGQGLLWLGFSFASGILAYGILPEEPAWPMVASLTLLVAAAGFYGVRRVPVGQPFLFALAFLAGVTVCTLRTAYVEAPRLGEPMNATVTGQIVERHLTGRGTRIVVSVISVDDQPVTAGDFPRRVRLRVPDEGSVGIGDTVQVRARLFPPAGPVSPGSYDFSFRAYFLGIGATGFGFGPPVRVAAGPVSSRLWLSAKVQDLRDVLVSQIRGALPERQETALIAALLVGDRSGIDAQVEEDLRAAGLAHILAISGLHMALFAGGAYSATVLVLALFPPLALRLPLHKWAAVLALLAASAYLVISGASVATQRSYLMIALVFVGVIFGRRGLTLRSVALAGLFLLLLAPERLFFPGFQMSFAAVICLVAVYDTWRQREREDLGSPDYSSREHSGRAMRFLRFVGRWCAGLFVTALVAGLATGIIGAHHFARIAPFGLLGNMLGMPVFSLLVMPMGVLALVLMPLGLASLPLTVMSFGLTLILQIAAFTADMGDGAGAVGKMGTPATLALVSALFIALLLPGWRRALALPPFLAGVLLVGLDRPPDVQLAASGYRIAARDEGGQLRYAPGRRSFATDLWLQDEGVPGKAIESRKMKSPQRRCDARGCVVRAHLSVDRPAGSAPASGRRSEFLTIAMPRTPEALEMDCRFADIIVSDLIVPPECRARLVLDGAHRARRGAVSLWLAQDGQAGAGASGGGAANKDPPPDTRQRSSGARQEQGKQTATEWQGSERIRVSKRVHAVPDPQRPWHRPGAVTRESLKRALREGRRDNR